MDKSEKHRRRDGKRDEDDKERYPTASQPNNNPAGCRKVMQHHERTLCHTKAKQQNTVKIEKKDEQPIDN